MLKYFKSLPSAQSVLRSVVATRGKMAGMVRDEQRFADLPVRIEQREIQVDGRGQTYGMLVPKAAPEPAGYPLILGLHYSSPTPGLSPYFGLGFVGQLVLPALQELNAILVAPDAPEANWTGMTSDRLITAVLAEVKKEFKVDERRTLIAGFSMGGAGTWTFISRHPDMFRAAIAIAAAPPAADAKPPQKLPVYVIHSQKDEVIPFDRIEIAMKALEEQDVNVTLAPVDDVSHHTPPAYIDTLAAAIPWIRRAWESK